MKKKSCFMVLLAICLFLVGCGDNSSENTSSQKQDSKKEIVINIGAPKAPPTLPILRMIDQNVLGDNIKINLEFWNTPEQVIAMTQDGKHDMFALPLTVAAKLYNKEANIKLTNVNTWGVTYFVSSDKNIKNWSDLKGKTVYVPLKSSPPDIMTQYFMESNNLKVGKDVQIKYSSTQEIGQLLKASKIENAVNIEPQVTASLMGNKNLEIKFNYNEEWKKIKGKDKNIPNAGMGATAKFIENNPEVVKNFEKEYEKALKWVLENPKDAAKLAETKLGLKKEIVEKAIPNFGLEYKNSRNAKEDLKSFYELLYKFDLKTIGGKVPSEDFYYGK